MRITFQVEGGLAHFPGLAKPLTIETADLPAEERIHLEGLIASAGAWNRPEQPVPARTSQPMRDYRTYTLELADGSRHRRLQFTDPVPPELSPLVRALQAEQKRPR